MLFIASSADEFGPENGGERCPSDDDSLFECLDDTDGRGRLVFNLSCKLYTNNLPTSSNGENNLTRNVISNPAHTKMTTTIFDRSLVADYYPGCDFLCPQFRWLKLCCSRRMNSSHSFCPHLFHHQQQQRTVNSFPRFANFQSVTKLSSSLSPSDAILDVSRLAEVETLPRADPPPRGLRTLTSARTFRFNFQYFRIKRHTTIPIRVLCVCIAPLTIAQV